MERSGAPMPEKVAENGYTYVERCFKSGSVSGPVDAKEESLRVRVFASTPARVHYAQRITANLGNFESAQVMVGIELPCYAEEVDAAFAEAKAWCDDRLAAEVREVERLKKKSGSR